jgi:hypothetical protein
VCESINDFFAFRIDMGFFHCTFLLSEKMFKTRDIYSLLSFGDDM